MPQEITPEEMKDVFDTYKTVLGEDFTIQSLIDASLGHLDVTRYTGDKPDVEKNLKVLGTLEHKLGLMKTDEDEHRSTGKFGVIQGLNPLLAHEQYLTHSAQWFMDPGKYTMELSRIEKAIEVQKKVLGKALELAGKVCFDYGSKTEEAEIEKVGGIDISSIYGRRDDLFVTYVKGNFPDLGKIASAKVTDATITDIAGKEYADNVLKYLGPSSTNNELSPLPGPRLLPVEGLLDLADLIREKTLKSELRGNLYRKELKRMGFDIELKSELIISDSHNQEAAILYFLARGKEGETLEDRNVLAVKLDRRYTHHSEAYACSMKHLQEEKARAKQVSGIDPEYVPFLKEFNFYGKTFS